MREREEEEEGTRTKKKPDERTCLFRKGTLGRDDAV